MWAEWASTPTPDPDAKFIYNEEYAIYAVGIDDLSGITFKSNAKGFVTGVVYTDFAGGKNKITADFSVDGISVGNRRVLSFQSRYTNDLEKKAYEAMPYLNDSKQGVFVYNFSLRKMEAGEHELSVTFWLGDENNTSITLGTSFRIADDGETFNDKLILERMGYTRDKVARTPTPKPTAAPTPEPTPTPTETPSPSPAPTPEPPEEPTPTPEPTPEPTEEPTPTPEPTPEPTEAPTPTPEPAEEPTAEPTSAPQMMADPEHGTFAAGIDDLSEVVFKTDGGRAKIFITGALYTVREYGQDDVAVDIAIDEEGATPDLRLTFHPGYTGETEKLARSIVSEPADSEYQGVFTCSLNIRKIEPGTHTLTVTVWLGDSNVSQNNTLTTSFRVGDDGETFTDETILERMGYTKE